MLVDFLKKIFVEWLELRDCDRHGLGSKPSHTILLCPWERHVTALPPAWQSWQTVPHFGHISIKLKNKIKNFKRTAISWHLPSTSR